MSDMFVVDGAPGTPGQLASYESYFASFSEPAQWPTSSQSMLSPIHTPPTWTGRNHRLRPDSGTGTIGVLENAGDLRIVRYDAAFDRPHALGYSFPSDRFELEICLDGRMEILENQAGRGDLVSGEVSVSPSRRTAGSVTFPAQERYRAISVSGSYDAFAAFLGSVGVTRFRQVMTHRSSSRGSRDYLGAPVTHPGALETGNLLYEEVGALLDAPGQVGPGELLTMECRIMAMLAGLLTDSESAIPGAAISDNSRHDVAIEQFERDRVQEVTQLLWERRHDLPTLREVARQVHMSPKRLSAVHRAVYGATVMERHRRRCVDRACHLLTATEWTVEHIGHHCGYATSSNFIYAFRLRLGCTPGEYRHEQRVH